MFVRSGDFIDSIHSSFFNISQSSISIYTKIVNKTEKNVNFASTNAFFSRWLAATILEFVLQLLL